MSTDDYQSDHEVDWHPMTVTVKAEQAEAEAPTLIVTRYQSYCAECDQVIYPGDLIAWFPMCTRPAVRRYCYVP